MLESVDTFLLGRVMIGIPGLPIDALLISPNPWPQRIQVLRTTVASMDASAAAAFACRECFPAVHSRDQLLAEVFSQLS
jgi:hypothetical protein